MMLSLNLMNAAWMILAVLSIGFYVSIRQQDSWASATQKTSRCPGGHDYQAYPVALVNMCPGLAKTKF